MTGNHKKIAGGLYLIVDASIESDILLQKIEIALREGIQVVQIYDSQKELPGKLKTINSICELCHSYQIPVLVNNEWILLNHSQLDGVHFDGIPEDYNWIKEKVNRQFLAGITCSNTLTTVEWAHCHNLDYISFCSMFPSTSVNTCEIVSLETVRKARKLTNIPIFLAGGISLDNIQTLKEISFDGIALISGIMSSPDAGLSTKLYVKSLNKIINHEN